MLWSLLNKQHKLLVAARVCFGINGFRCSRRTCGECCDASVVTNQSVSVLL